MKDDVATGMFATTPEEGVDDLTGRDGDTSPHDVEDEGQDDPQREEDEEQGRSFVHRAHGARLLVCKGTGRMLIEASKFVPSIP
mgnify:FL=1